MFLDMATQAHTAFKDLPSGEQDQIMADEALIARYENDVSGEVWSDALMLALAEARRRLKARKDSAMLGDSGYARNAADFYPTPPENVDVLLTHFQPLPGPIWEPACGDGAISKRLTALGYSTVSTDLFDYGYGETGPHCDFLMATEMPSVSRYADEGAPYVQSRCLITNPPYADLAEKFIRHALDLTEPVRGQVAMFLRNEYDCSKGKMSLFGMPPFHAKIIVTKRPRWIEGSTGSPRHNYAWYIWDWRHIKGPAAVYYSHPSKAKPLRRDA